MSKTLAPSAVTAAATAVIVTGLSLAVVPSYGSVDLLSISNNASVTLGNYCSGTVVDDEKDLIATAAHCVKDNQEDIVITRRIFDEEGREVAKYRYEAKVVGLDRKNDAAVLQLTSGDFLPDTAVEIDRDGVTYGQTVFSVANPWMVYRVISEGYVIKPWNSDDFLEHSILATVYSAPGSSGGAILDEEGEITSVIFGGYGDNMRGNVMNISIPIKYHLSLISKLDS